MDQQTKEQWFDSGFALFGTDVLSWEIPCPDCGSPVLLVSLFQNTLDKQDIVALTILLDSEIVQLKSLLKTESSVNISDVDGFFSNRLIAYLRIKEKLIRLWQHIYIQENRL
jgi:hypothetical protein